MTYHPEYSQPARYASTAFFGDVCRLGLATRGNTRLDPEDVEEAMRRGVDYLNWCCHADGLSAAVRRLGERRRSVCVAAQFMAKTARDAREELRELLGELGTDYIDVVTYYYMEAPEEWEEIISPGGAAQVLEEARRDGLVRCIGLTSHQRGLAADIARSGRVDLLMIRYNAAHRGAEQDVFGVTSELGMPVVAYTGLRWGALLQSTPDDPPGFVPPSPPSWYRFVLCHPSVTVALIAPNGREELEEDLSILDCWRGLDEAEYMKLCGHGDRVNRHGGTFP